MNRTLARVTRYFSGAMLGKAMFFLAVSGQFKPKRAFSITREADFMLSSYWTESGLLFVLKLRIADGAAEWT